MRFQQFVLPVVALCVAAVNCLPVQLNLDLEQREEPFERRDVHFPHDAHVPESQKQGITDSINAHINSLPYNHAVHGADRATVRVGPHPTPGHNGQVRDPKHVTVDFSRNGLPITTHHVYPGGITQNQAWGDHNHHVTQASLARQDARASHTAANTAGRDAAHHEGEAERHRTVIRGARRELRAAERQGDHYGAQNIRGDITHHGGEARYHDGEAATHRTNQGIHLQNEQTHLATAAHHTNQIHSGWP